MAEFVKVASKSEIENGRGKVVEVKGKEIAVLNDNGRFFAIENKCAHRQGPIGEGSCENGVVTCPWHGWSYDLKSGKNKMDEKIRLQTYEVKIKEDGVLVKA